MKKPLLVIVFIVVFLVGVVAGAAGFYFVVLRQFAGQQKSGGLPAGTEVPTLNPFESGYENPFSNVNPFAR